MKTKGNRAILKAAGEKWQTKSKIKMWVTLGFSQQPWRPERKKRSTENSHLMKTSWKYDGEIETVSNERKLRGFVANRPALKYTLKKFFRDLREKIRTLEIKEEEQKW